MAETSGVKDLRLGIAYNQMGTGFMMVGNIDEAINSFRTAVDVYESLPDATTYTLTIPLANLGVAYWIQGRYDESLNILERALADRERMYGPMDRESFR